MGMVLTTSQRAAAQGIREMEMGLGSWCPEVLPVGLI